MWVKRRSQKNEKKLKALLKPAWNQTSSINFAFIAGTENTNKNIYIN